MPEDNKAKELMQEELGEKLLEQAYQSGTMNVYDFVAATFSPQQKEFSEIKFVADMLVKDKLATYADNERTLLSITNFGRYWMVKGGYLSYLKESHLKERSTDKQQAKEELLEARLRLTHFRLIGFWLTLVVSIVGFALSVFNLFMLLNGRK